ncbi:HIG1 domain family member 1C-like [Homalodisca vitripennis]|uniref:HIG1 domain family member 1C-like n=1 Tax=Homalodisca vitripennis TaxID=197043 RepID=UPI001EEAD299|nr:HIG1 domain family member 1C-like [Homalodisca vitripennis]
MEQQLVEEINMLNQQESLAEKLTRKLKEDPAVGVGMAGLVAVCAVGGNRYRRGAFTIPSSLYLLQLRVLAQGAVVGSLAGGIAYTMYQHFRSGSHAADVEKEQ